MLCRRRFLESTFVAAIAKDPVAAKAKVLKAQAVLRERQSAAIGRVRQGVGG